MERIKSYIYTKCRIESTDYTQDGFLYSQGRFKTKIKNEDMPEWYVEGFVYKTPGYIRAKDVVDLKYIPRFFNHLFKDDLLLISYTKPIVEDIESICFFTSDERLNGFMIPRFMEAVKKYSVVDTTEIDQAIKDKWKWFEENYPEEMKKGIY